MHGIGAAISLALLAPAAHAQKQDTVRLPDVVIEALRTPVALDSIPFSVSVADALPGRPGMALDEILTAIPGVQADNRYNYAVGDRISIRGFGARTQFGVRGVRVALDGIPATFADGQSLLESIDPDLLDRAEVIRGPGASLYGNASGGVLLLRSAPAPSLPELTIRATDMGAGLRRLGVGFGATSGALAYTGDVSRMDFDGYREHSAARATRGVGELAYRPSEGDELRLNTEYVEFSADNPGSLSRAMLDENPLQAYATNVKQATGKSGHQAQAGLTWSHALGGANLELGGHVIGRRVYNPIVGRIIDLGRTAGGLRGLLSGRLDLLGRRIDLALGADLDLQADDRQNYVNQNGHRGALALDQRETVTGLGSFLQASLPIVGPLRMMGSVRYDRTRFVVDDSLVTPDDPDDSGNRTMDAVSPSIGLLWAPVEALSLYGNVGTAFETPTTTELANRPDGAGGFNPDLEPQHALSMEAGIRGHLGKLLSAELAVYSIDITDELIPFQEENFPGRDFYRNAGSARHRGAELSMMLTPISGLVARIGYAFTDARFRSYTADGVTYDGNRVPGVAPGSLQAALTYVTPWAGDAALQAGLDLRSTSSIPVNDANSASSPGYTIVNLRLGYSAPDGPPILFGLLLGATAFVGVENVFDTRYNTSVTVNAAGDRYFEPGRGRSFYFTTRLTIH